MNKTEFEILKRIGKNPKIFITGTGTDVGKSYATGWLAHELNNICISCITQKFIQTGNQGRSEDIELHRKIMGRGLLNEDLDQTTFPEVFSYPCSPDLAARIDKREIDFNKILNATNRLEEAFDVVLIEGAGGIMVPLKDFYLTADYIRDQKLPAIVVISGELGSINHALLTLNAVKDYNIPLLGVIYNPFFDKDKIICEDTRRFLKEWINVKFDNPFWLDMPQKITLH